VRKKKQKLPLFANLLAKLILPKSDKFFLNGDLNEIYYHILETEGRFTAWRWYWWQIISSIPHFIADSFYWRISMFTNYFKIAFRNFLKHKSFTAINIFGLTLGMVCCIIVFKFILAQTGYDSYFPNKNRLFRITVASEVLSTGEKSTGALSPLLWTPTMEKNYPEIENSTRIVKSWDPLTFEVGESRISQPQVYYGEDTILGLFNWKIISGNQDNLFKEPNTVVISESCAKKYFNDTNVVGKTISHVQQKRDENGKIVEIKKPLKITGLMANIPEKSHIRPEVLISFISLNEIYGGDINAGSHPNPDFWRYTIGYSYVLLKEKTDPKELESKFPDFLKQHIGDANISRGFKYLPYLQNVSGIHLEKNVHSTPESGTNKDQLYIFTLVAFFILLIACFNFINLSTARSGSRSLEVGIRKVVGCKRINLITQFISESILLSMIAIFLALILSELISPIFTYYTGVDIELSSKEIPYFILGLFTIILFVGVLAGSYPAFFLASFQPIKVLKRSLHLETRGVFFRKVLVILQFVITIFFIISTFTIRDQIIFMKTQPLGFVDSQILVMAPTSNIPLYHQMETLKNELNNQSNIQDISLSSVVPGRMYWRDLWTVFGKPKQETTVLKEIEVDFNFFDLYQLELVAGRKFLPEMVTDRQKDFTDLIETDLGNLQKGKIDSRKPKEMAIILNEKAVQQLGFKSSDEALGKILVRDPVAVDFYGRIIGVVNNFHFESLQAEIQPLVLFMHDPSAQYPMHVSIKLSNQNFSRTIATVQNTWRTHFPESNFESFFIDENFGKLYAQEEKILKVYGYVSVFSIFIACLGLLGLILYMVEQKTKEIGIRKVLGSSTIGIMVLLSKKLITWILLANLITVPIAFLIMGRWLENFAYRTNIGFLAFIFSGVITLVITLLTISFQSFKAARANPVDSLKYE